MPTCFVIMPITTPPERVERYGGDTDHFEHVIDYLFAPAVEQAGYQIVKPAFNDSQLIQAQIIRYLETADIVLCDISGWNANVFFELGIRVALDKPVALVRDTQTPTIPFDNAFVACHQYDCRLDPWYTKDEIPKLKALIEEVGSQDQNALWKYFGITKRAQESDPGDPTQAKLDLLAADVEALRASLSPDHSTEPTLHSDRLAEALPKFGRNLDITRSNAHRFVAAVPIRLVNSIDNIRQGDKTNEIVIQMVMPSGVDLTNSDIRTILDAAKRHFPGYRARVEELPF